ncbi:head decoration protein [Fodinicurvata fenggangensis]|uniref:head decoration protein n=1 Tax=Fodinicurvata fenggangensis TaxID=1121830 RepID=UPI0004799E3A|nr:head decoration protein [Fodinicurvata fenggangensis]
MPADSAEFEYQPGHFVSGDFPIHTQPVTIASGEELEARSVLGQVTADGTFKLSASGASDGSETPKAILAYAVDASGGAVEAAVYMSGSFDPDKLVYGTGHDAESVAQALLGSPIFLRKPDQR